MSTTADAPSTRRYKNCLAVSQMIGVAAAGKNEMRASAAGTRREQRRTDENSGTAKTAMRRASSIAVTGSHGTYLLPGFFSPSRYPSSAKSVSENCTNGWSAKSTQAIHVQRFTLLKLVLVLLHTVEAVAMAGFPAIADLICRPSGGCSGGWQSPHTPQPDEVVCVAKRRKRGGGRTGGRKS